ncbi:MAG: hypothetical protein DMG57_36835 [Acidobacteria bacterium]|nr:MAG: hypothetical protein DMG57_36835 [Acidobacteriota bacterium]
MKQVFDAFRLLLISVAGWLGQQQRDVIDYLQEENRVLRDQLGNKRLRVSDDSACDWQPKPRNSAGASCVKWPRSSHPIRFWLGTGS